MKLYVIAIVLLINLQAPKAFSADECKVLVVVGMKDEKNIVMGKAPHGSIQVVVGTANADVLRKRLEAIDPAYIHAVFSFGVAGGLNTDLVPGDLLFSQQVLSQINDENNHSVEIGWPVDQHLVTVAALHATKAGVEYRKGVFLGADTEARDQVFDVVTRLHEITGADIIDNETHIAAQFASEHHLPFLSIRAVSDSVHIPLPPAALLPLDSEDGGPDGMAIAKNLFLNPLQIPALIRAAGNYRKALSALQVFMDSVGLEKLVSGNRQSCLKGNSFSVSAL